MSEDNRVPGKLIRNTGSVSLKTMKCAGVVEFRAIAASTRYMF